MVKIITVPEWRCPAIRHGVAITGLVLRLLFGALFIVSGALKAVDPGVFLLDVRSFQVLRDPWAAWLAMTLPWLEIISGLALVLGGLARGALVIFLISIALFIGALAQAWARGLDVTCGCFGRSENHTDFPAQIGFDALLLVAGGFLWWMQMELAKAGADVRAVRGGALQAPAP